jgi:TP901 family phage tail tape measure protein
MAETTDTIALKIQVRDDGSVVIRNFQKQIKSETNKVKGHFTGLTNNLKTFLKTTGLLVSATAAFVALGRAVRSVVADTINFQSEFTQVRNIVDESQVDIAGLEAGILNMGGALGGVGNLTKGTYQVISSMQKPKQALDDLTAAAMFAQGGQTALNSAVLAGTGIVNAFGVEAGGLNHVYDILWQTIKDGVTTAPELANAIGRVTPIAHEAGLSLEEMAGSIAVMTQISGNTNETVTSLRGILAEVIKPSQEAAAEAERLGINFSTAGIKAMGFSNWLQDVLQKVQANNGDMAKLWGRVDALNGIFQLSRDNLSAFNNEMANMSQVQGNNEKAFENWKKSFSGAWETLWNKVKAIFVKTLLPLLKSAAEWISENSEQITGFIESAIDAFKSVISFIAQFKDIIIMAGKAWLLHFAITKFTPVFSALKTGFMTAGTVIRGSMFRAVESFKLARTFGAGTFNSLKSAAIEAGHAFPGVTKKIATLGKAISAIPTSIKITIALVIAEQAGKLLAAYFDEWSAYYDYEMSRIAAESDVKLVPKHAINEAIHEFSRLGEAQKKVVDEVRAKLKELSKDAEGGAKLYHTFTDKTTLLLNELKKTSLWNEWGEKIEETRKKTDALIKSYSASKLEIIQNKVKTQELISKTTALISDIDKLGSKYLPREITALKNLRGELKEKIKLIKEDTIQTGKQNKALEKLLDSIGLLSDKKLGELQTEISEWTGYLKENEDVLNTNDTALLKIRDRVDELIGVYRAAGRDITPGLETLEEKTLDLLLATGNYAMEVPELKTKITELTPSVNLLSNEFNAWIWQFNSLNLSLQLMTGTLMPSFKQETEKAAKPTESLKEKTQELSQVFANLATIGNQVIDLLVDMGVISGNLGKTFRGLTGGIAGIGAGLNAIKTAGAGFQGTLQKISGGLSIFTSGLTIATSLVKGLIDLFTKERDWAGEAREAMAGMPGMTQEWIDKVAELGEELGSVKKAFRQLMAEIISDSVTSQQSFETWANQVMTLFDHIGNITMDPGTGIVISRESVENLDNAFGALIEKADLLGMHGSRAMLQIIAKAKELGLVVPSIVDYIDSRFETSLDAMGTYIETMQGTYQQNAEFLDTTITGIFTAMRGEGYSFIEIVTRMKDGLVKLREKAETEGGAVSDAIRQMTDLAFFIEQNKTLVENIESTRQMMEGLGDTGYLTEETFTSFLTKTTGNFESLKAAGASEIDSLRILSAILKA